MAIRANEGPKGRGGRRRPTRISVVLLWARRLSRREHVVAPNVRRGQWGALVVAVGCGLPILMGFGHSVLIGLAALAALAFLVLACVRAFSPGLAVSVLGVALACASLMTALSVTTGFERAIVSAVSGLNGHVLLTKYGLDFFEYEQIAIEWKEDPRIRAASPFAYSMVALVPEQGDDATEAVLPLNAMAKGLDPKFAKDLPGISERLGRGDLSGLRPGDTRHVPGLVLGVRLARALGVEVGDRVRVVVPAEIDGHDGQAARPPRHSTFEVLDLLTTGISDIDREVALMHITAAQALFFGEGRVTGIEFELEDPDLAEVVGADLEARLGAIFRTTTWKRTQAVFLVSLRQIRAALTVVLGLMILVSSASLIASLLLLVRRKRGQLAVLRALGADPRLSFWIFEGVGLWVGTVGAAAGSTLGAFFCALLWRFDLALDGGVYPVEALPIYVGWADVLGPAVAAITLCAVASGPVALMGAGAPILAGLRR